MTRDEMIQAVSDTAFVEKDDCDRVVTSYHRVVKKEVEKQVKKYAIIVGAVTAFLGVFALIFYLLGKSSRGSDDE